MVFRFVSEHMKLYRDLAALFVKYGRSDLVRQAGFEDALEGDPGAEPEQVATADELPQDLQRMGPTFVKLGQLMSTRPDLIPAPYIKALARLQDECEHFPAEEARRVVEAELGVKVSKAFSEFEDVPLAAASLGQVHFARMRDGRPVAVKVERPAIRSQILEQLDILLEIASFLDNYTDLGRRYNLRDMLTEFRMSLLHELNYREEARHLTTIHDNLAEFTRIVVPTPILDYTTSKVLTMHFIAGQKITSVSPLALTELDASPVVEELFEAYLKQIFVDGIFHADPHPGNLLLMEDGKIALIDLGMVGRISGTLQERLLQLLLAMSEGRAMEVAKISTEMSELAKDFDYQFYARQVEDQIVGQQNLQVGEMDMGEMMTELSRISGEAGIKLPTELTMLGKALLNLDHVGHILDPHFEPASCVRRNAWRIVRQRMYKGFSFYSVLSKYLEAKQFVIDVPERIIKILDRVANNEVSVDVIDEDRLINGLKNIANRITVGLILAALIMGAATLMRVKTNFQILGYPGFAMILFLLAALGGTIFVLSIVFNKDKSD